MLTAMKWLNDISICVFNQIRCCFRSKKHSIKEFRRQYKLLNIIERGGFGKVYQGYRLSDGLPVAVKFVRHRQVTDWTLAGKELIPSEIWFLERCQDCEGVIPLVDWFKNAKGFLLVMSCPQRFIDLFDLLNMLGRLDEHIARGIFIQIVKTVTDLQRRHSVIHGDIKDENIILDLNTGKVWLCDFGAAEFQERARFRQFQGTKSYCPPEVFQKKRGSCNYLPLEATVWSLGIFLYTMLVGHPPFKGDDELQIYKGHLRFPDYISQECCSLLKCCLCSIPEYRILLDQIESHPWLMSNNSPLDSIGNPLRRMQTQKLFKRQCSFGTGRTESESSDEEECSYRTQITAAGMNPMPISIPLDLQQKYLNDEWPSVYKFDFEEKHLADSSGFSSNISKGILQQSFYDNLTTNSSYEEEMATANQSFDSGLFSSSACCSYHSLDQRSSAESIISSIYFSTYSISKESQINSELDEVEEEEDLTMIAEPENKRNKIDRKFLQKNEERSSESEEEETIRVNIELV